MPPQIESEKTFDKDAAESLVSTYAAELEVEVDRLRIREDLIRNEANEFLTLISPLVDSDLNAGEWSAVRKEIRETTHSFRELLSYFNDQAGPTLARDEVSSIDLQELIEQVFITQQRVHLATEAVLHLSLQTQTILWFPNRMRHILHNLLGNALRFRDTAKGETRVSVTVKAVNGQFELRVSDNGTGITAALSTSLLDLPQRAAQKRRMHSSMGLAVVQFLVHQSCGSVEIESREDQGTSIVVHLPQYVVGDFLEPAGG